MASKAVFADTSFFFALVAKRDPAHQAAVSAYAKLLRARGQVFTTDYVIDETLTLTKARINAQTAVALLDRIEASEAVAIEHHDPHAGAIRKVSGHIGGRTTEDGCNHPPVVRRPSSVV